MLSPEQPAAHTVTLRLMTVCSQASVLMPTANQHVYLQSWSKDSLFAYVSGPQQQASIRNEVLDSVTLCVHLHRY